MTHSDIELIFSILFLFTSVSGLSVLMSMHRKYAVRRMTRHHILWHTLPAWLLVPSGLLLSSACLKHTVSEGIGVLADGSPMQADMLLSVAFIMWLIGVGGWISHVVMESSEKYNKHLFKGSYK